MSQINTLCVLGPTGSGKTQLALQLVDEIDCEIISIDSALVYRGMDIGTAKPDKKTQLSKPHHLIDICDVTQPYSAAQCEQDATAHIQAIHGRGRTALLVGGTMLYFRALLLGLAPMPMVAANVRDELAMRIAQGDLAALHAQLARVDPVSAKRIKPSDPQRITRALGVYLTTGKPLSAYWADQVHAQTWQQQACWISLQPSSRQILHDRIQARFHAMLAAGFMEEVRCFYQRDDVHADLPAMRSVGYRQAWAHLAGEITYDEMIARAIIATRQLAKRQLTWLRTWPCPLHAYNCDDEADLDKVAQGVIAALKAG